MNFCLFLKYKLKIFIYSFFQRSLSNNVHNLKKKY